MSWRTLVRIKDKNERIRNWKYNIRKRSKTCNSYIYTSNQFNSIGYDETQKEIRTNLDIFKGEQYSILTEYLNNRINKNEKFEPYKEELLKLTLELNENKLENWSNNKKTQGLTKQTLFDILSELIVYINSNTKTKDDDNYFDLIADFLDRFTYLGKNYRIYSDEPNVNHS